MLYQEEFKNYLVDEKKVSSNTLESYLRDIGQFAVFEEKNSLEPATTSYEDITRYIDSLRENGRSAATVTRAVASIRCFYHFLLSTQRIETDPTKELKMKKPAKKLPEILTGAEIDQLLAQPDTNDAKGCRDKAMLELLYATGIRVSELVDLNIDDINVQIGILYCRSGKNKRVIPVHQVAVQAVTRYLHDVRGGIVHGQGEEALFTNMNGERLTRQGFWKIIKNYTQMAKIKKDITPHTLRHSFATHLLENGAQLKDIQEMLGHADISSTQVYAEIVKDHFFQAYQKFHPRVNSSK